MGDVLIAGTASLLICVFLAPKFIALPARAGVRPDIRDEGPQGHHAKAGTPTMGGLIIFLAIAVPFLILSATTTPAPWACSATAIALRALGFADDYMKIVTAARSGCAGARS